MYKYAKYTIKDGVLNLHLLYSEEQLIEFSLGSEILKDVDIQLSGSTLTIQWQKEFDICYAIKYFDYSYFADPYEGINIDDIPSHLEYDKSLIQIYHKTVKTGLLSKEIKEIKYIPYYTLLRSKDRKSSLYKIITSSFIIHDYLHQ